MTAGTYQPGSKPWRLPPMFWPFTIVLLPVVVLAIIGFISLRQDRALVEKDAQERAQALANEISQKAWLAVTAPPVEGDAAPRALLAADTGALLSPKSYPPTPMPAPLEPTELSDSQRALWLAAQARATNAAALAAAAANLARFLESAPPEGFAAIGHFTLGRCFVQAGQTAAASNHFAIVAGSYSNAVGETGVPLRPLALLNLLELARQSPPPALQRRAALEEICQAALATPSVLTPQLLGRAKELEQAEAGSGLAAKWSRQWEVDELSRALYAATQPQFRPLPTNTNVVRKVHMNYAGPAEQLLAVTLGEELWFAHTEGPTKQGVWLNYQRQADLTEALGRLRTITPIPDYFGVSIEVAGRLVAELRATDAIERVSSMTRSGGRETLVPRREFPWSTNRVLGELLATSTVEGTAMAWPTGRVGSPETLLQVHVYLTDSVALYARQQARTWWLACLIGVSALAALIGLAYAGRAFQRQQVLAEMKTNFVSSVSHELRAPIASVRLMAESLERGKIPEPTKQKEYFQMIGQETRRLSALIENVLDFARIEQGRKQYEFEPTDLRALVAATVKLMEPMAAERGVRLEVRMPDAGCRMPDVEVDGRAIQQALVNLVDNALKHSPAGERVQVELAGGRIPEGVAAASGLTLSVSDHGPGIPAAEQQRIFERFHRLGSELRRETQGVGIGLSIVKHIVESHGGQVRVESEVGKGSRFTIELPVNPEERENDE